MKRFAEHPVKYAVVTFVSVFLLASILFSCFESDANLADGIWWAFVTATTVGYGDLSPQTPGIRMVAATLMTVGIATTATLTAALAARIVAVRIEDANDTPELDDDVDYIIAHLESLKSKLEKGK